MMSLPVVVVVATHDAERLGFLTGRCLPSIAKQTSKADLVIVVSDNDPSTDFLNDDHIRSCFDADDRKKVRLIPNNRTRGNSGTGSWNSGILSALASFGHDCFVAFLDDDDEWENNHLETCLKAANENSMWVVSGIVRISGTNTFSSRNPQLIIFHCKPWNTREQPLCAGIGSTWCRSL